MKKYLTNVNFVLKPWHIIVVSILCWALVLIILGRFGINVFKQTAQPQIYKSLNIPELLRFSFNWDAGWYYAIAEHGYGKSITPVFAFFPLYPMLIVLIHKIGLNYVWSAFLLNFAATCLALIALYKLSLEFLDVKKSYLVVFLFMAFPMSFFMFSFYTEAVFCALSFWSIYFARKQHWAAASVLAALCSATRLVGLLLLVPILIEYLKSKKYKLHSLDYNAFWFVLIPAGFVSYMIYAKYQTGNFFAMFHAYKVGEWTYQSFQPNFILTLYKQTSAVIHNGDILTLIPLLCWFGFLTIIFLARKKLPISYVVYVLVSLVVFVLNSNVVSVNRYVLPLFPVYIAAVMLLQKKEEFIYMLITLLAIAQGVFFIVFANGFWVG